MKFAHHIAHLFFPRQSNNHKAKILQPIGLFLITFFVVITQVVLGNQHYLSGRVLGYAANISPQEVIRLTNLKRVEAGLPPLTENRSLSEGAQAKGRNMLSLGYWAHAAPDGTQPWKFFNDVSYTYRYAGENLARDFSNPISAVNAWMASVTHRENMLSSRYKEIGVAVVEGSLEGTDTTIIVQFFGTRMGDVIPQTPVDKKTEVGAAQGAPAVNGLSLSARQESTSEFISPLSLNKKVTIFIIGFLVVLMTIDWIIVSAKRITRVSGRTFAHTAFLGMILAIVLIAKAGRIL